MWRPSKSKDLLLNGDVDIKTPPGTDGLCYYTAVSGDFEVEGRFLAEVEGTKAGVVMSWQTFDIIVKESG